MHALGWRGRLCTQLERRGQLAESAAYLESVANFSGSARDLVDQLDLACTEMLASLNADVPPVPETTPERMTAKCKVLVETIRARTRRASRSTSAILR